jgi:hypothetical protein
MPDLMCGYNLFRLRVFRRRARRSPGRGMPGREQHDKCEYCNDGSKVFEHCTLHLSGGLQTEQGVFLPTILSGVWLSLNTMLISILAKRKNQSLHARKMSKAFRRSNM